MSGITRDTLMAFVDGHLDPTGRTEVEAFLAANPEVAAEVALLQRQNDAIRTLYAPAGAEPIPVRLSVDRIAHSGRRRNNRFLTQAAAAVVLVGVGLAGGWLLRGNADTPGIADRLIADAVSAHTVYVLEKRHAVEVGGDEEEHLSSWLSNRLQTNLAMPDLTASGLTFLGGRLLPAPDVPGGKAAQLMYEDANGERLTLYITPRPGIDAPRTELASLGADTALFWSDDMLTCTITAPYSADKLEAIASAVFAQLNPSGDGYEI
ncbi:hypothetical protein VW35_15640 [Devosia soli]|uniref:Anti-sigma factor n=1 Tax=Devosia soli TaxID=361041 RepID=A0A0F5L429_9HYPH|nr:anti-sigma factor [Devosia soli]KKB77151.1 hypothetical protein VW35_15640 [Devosia soli]